MFRKHKRLAPMAKCSIKKNQEVVVTSGAHRGKRGKVLAVLYTQQRVIVEGVHLIKRATRKSQQHPQGGMIEREGSLHISNVMPAERYDSRRGNAGAATTTASKPTKAKTKASAAA
jgi:large subunit ribosomal protein L24